MGLKFENSFEITAPVDRTGALLVSDEPSFASGAKPARVLTRY